MPAHFYYGFSKYFCVFSQKTSYLPADVYFTYYLDVWTCYATFASRCSTTPQLRFAKNASTYFFFSDGA